MKFFLQQPAARFPKNIANEQRSHQDSLFRVGGAKKNPRAAVWQIYLNLVTKGVPYGLHQASKFPREKLAHRKSIKAPVK